MIYMKTIFSILLLLSFSGATHGSDNSLHLTLGTSMPIKALTQNNTTSDDATKQVDCILNKMQTDYRIRLLPWRRAKQEVHSQILDGFFPAVAVDEASNFATLSTPLVLENWYWFWRADTPEPATWKEKSRIGVILGGQQESILVNEGYTTFTTANNAQQLVKLLFAERIDALLMDKEEFENLAVQMSVKESEYNSRFFRYQSMGVYFGELFLESHPNFLTTFNSFASSCITSDFELSANEKKRIQNTVAPLLKKLSTNKSIISAIVKQNQVNSNKPDSELKNLNRQWVEEFAKGNIDFSKAIVNEEASKILKQYQTENAELLSEIIVMDARGYNVAVTDMTSDYWQGDENKFKQTFNKPAQTIFIEKIEYDASSKYFQVNVSSKIINPETNEAIGVITMGVDVDKALSLEN